MKFGGFKIGKLMEGKGKEKAAAGGGVATQIAELEEQLSDRTNSLKQTEAKLKKLSGKNKSGKDVDDVPVIPHGPIAELILEPEVDIASLTATAEEEIEIVSEESTEKIKLVEVKPEPVSPPAAAKDMKADLSNDSLNSLFSQDEEEENPLANLVKSLPEVAASELLDDIKEIKGIIEDWQKK